MEGYLLNNVTIFSLANKVHNVTYSVFEASPSVPHPNHRSGVPLGQPWGPSKPQARIFVVENTEDEAQVRKPNLFHGNSNAHPWWNFPLTCTHCRFLCLCLLRNSNKKNVVEVEYAELVSRMRFLCCSSSIQWLGELRISDAQHCRNKVFVCEVGETCFVSKASSFFIFISPFNFFFCVWVGCNMDLVEF